MKRSASSRETLKCPACGSYGGTCPTDCPIQMYSTKREYFFQKKRKLNLTKQDELFMENSTGLNFDKYMSIPVTVTGDNLPKPWTKFELKKLGPILERNVQLAKYEKPTPVQQHAIPIILEGRDVMACAQTGSGKTAAYLFPMIAAGTKGKSLMTEIEYKKMLNSFSTVRQVKPMGLILAPTRELAEQIYDEAKKFTFCSPMKPVCVYGGSPYFLQEQQLKKGADIVVGTPGRLIDFIEKNVIDLSAVQYFCLDEADRMLDMGFEDDVRKIASYLPETKKRITVLFSATFPKEIRELADDFLNLFTKATIRVGRIGSTTDNIQQIIKKVPESEKKAALFDVLAEAKSVKGTVLIFVSKKITAQEVGDSLYSGGFAVASIHGDRQQIEREAALEAFRDKRINILVATSVVARGLDIDHITHVINYDFPDNIDEYVHRIGRTGRVGHIGKAISFLPPGKLNDTRFMTKLHKLLVESKQTVPDFLAPFEFKSSTPSSYRSENSRGRDWGRGRARGRERGRGRGGLLSVW